MYRVGSQTPVIEATKLAMTLPLCIIVLNIPCLLASKVTHYFDSLFYNVNRQNIRELQSFVRENNVFSFGHRQFYIFIPKINIHAVDHILKRLRGLDY